MIASPSPCVDEFTAGLNYTTWSRRLMVATPTGPPRTVRMDEGKPVIIERPQGEVEIEWTASSSDSRLVILASNLNGGAEQHVHVTAAAHVTTLSVPYTDLHAHQAYVKVITQLESFMVLLDPHA